MIGADGKSAWALRNTIEGKNAGKGQRINPFDDWLNSVGSETKSLKTRVLETAAGQADFHKAMREESRRFRHFYLKEQKDTEALAEGRILYCKEGMALKRKQQRAKENAERAAARSRSVSAAEQMTSVDSEVDGNQISVMTPASGQSPSVAGGRSPSFSFSGDQQMDDQQMSLYKEYGIKSSASKPRLSDMNKLLAASQNRALDAFQDPESRKAKKEKRRRAIVTDMTSIASIGAQLGIL